MRWGTLAVATQKSSSHTFSLEVWVMDPLKAENQEVFEGQTPILKRYLENILYIPGLQLSSLSYLGDMLHVIYSSYK